MCEFGLDFWTARDASPAGPYNSLFIVVSFPSLPPLRLIPLKALTSVGTVYVHTLRSLPASDDIEDAKLRYPLPWSSSIFPHPLHPRIEFLPAHVRGREIRDMFSGRPRTLRVVCGFRVPVPTVQPSGATEL